MTPRRCGKLKAGAVPARHGPRCSHVTQQRGSFQRRNSQGDGRVRGFAPLHQCIQKGLGRSTPSTCMLCQQRLLNCTQVRLEGPQRPGEVMLALMGPSPALRLNTRLPGCHSIPCHHPPHTTTATGVGCAVSVGCVPPPPGTILRGSKTGSQSSQAALALPPPLPLLLLFPCDAKAAFCSTEPHPPALMGGLSGHALAGGDRSGLESDPDRRLSCLFPIHLEV